MEAKLERVLLSKFPEIFNVSSEDPDDYLWGIHCEDGWTPLIHTMCQQLQLHVDQTGRDQIVARQIKQKMGILRCLFSGSDEYTRGVVDTVVAMSYVTCELCGNKGVMGRGRKGWVRVLCGPCRLNNPD